MINYGLPTTVTVNGKEREIRSDYRAILDIISALNDVNLSDEEKAYVTLKIFYPQFDDITAEEAQEAIEKCFNFIECGNKDDGKKQPKLVDWEQDFQYIITPINAVAGKEVRALDYLHWWTFISYYYEISGECTFAQIVSIRDKQARGKQLDKQEREWYRRNQTKVDIKNRYSEKEEELLKMWGGTNG